MKITRVEEEHPCSKVNCVTRFKLDIALIQTVHYDLYHPNQIRKWHRMEFDTLRNATK